MVVVTFLVCLTRLELSRVEGYQGAYLLYSLRGLGRGQKCLSG